MGNIFPICVISSIQRPRTITRNLTDCAIDRRISVEDPTEYIFINNDWAFVTDTAKSMLFCSDTCVHTMKQVIDTDDEYNSLIFFYTSI